MRKAFIIILSICCVVGCFNIDSAASKVKAPAHKSIVTSANSKDIPYIVADHYFVSNDLHSLPPVKITSKKVFDRCFGMAAVMGKNGQPTDINFARQYVISVSLPASAVLVELTPVSLRKRPNGSLVFSYRIKKGEEQSYITQPLLLIVVDKKFKGKVVLNPMQ
jgi:hypothetical protein